MKELLNHEVFRLFEQISAIPRESGNEKAISNWIKSWCEERCLPVKQDDIFNLTVTKPASPGYESHSPLLLQAHIDMVCEKANDSTHDFTRDPITFKVEGDWLSSATGTTLGADNGIGVACAMAILDNNELEHPPIEVAFTVQEETTFDGAESIDVSGLKSRRMINLDHANERELIVGSCGGVGVEMTMPLDRSEEIPEDCKAFRVFLTGLRGGHSGEDIHRGRGNAIQMLVRVLEDLSLPVVRITGGTNRLAIPREAEAVVLTGDEDILRKGLESLEETYRKEFGNSAPDLRLGYEETELGTPMTGESFSAIAAIMRLHPNGIMRMNENFNCVESSNNIGIISTEGDRLKLVSEIRGGHQSTVDDITRTIELVAALFGAKVSFFDRYVPWEFSASSELRELAVKVYKEHFNEEMRQLAVHAGLECGFFANKIPGMDIISIGPDCENFHSPQERVSISSTKRFYQFLTGLLSKL